LKGLNKGKLLNNKIESPAGNKKPLLLKNPSMVEEKEKKGFYPAKSALEEYKSVQQAKLRFDNAQC